MADKTCPQCAETIKRDARVCRFCGASLPVDQPAPVAPKKSGALKWVGIGFAVLIGLRLVSGVSETTSGSQAAAGAAEADAEATETLDAPEAGTSWTYSEQKDEMRGSTQKLAAVDSSNSLEFGFPYNGGSTGTLTLRKRAQDGLQSYLSVTKGQFVCHSFTGGRIAVKFDNGPIQRIACGEPSDGTTNVIFLRDPRRLLAGLRKAKTMTIEAEFFNEGSRQLTFAVAGLQWQ